MEKMAIISKPMQYQTLYGADPIFCSMIGKSLIKKCIIIENKNLRKGNKLIEKVIDDQKCDDETLQSFYSS